MTEIPEMYLAEARRRAPQFSFVGQVVQILARTLQELGWTPPIDEARMAKARKVTAAVFEATDMDGAARGVLTVLRAFQAAYDALGED